MAQRLARLRQLLNTHNLSAYVLPRTDEHQSQYISERDQRVRFISGFKGSNALAFISQSEALLWTDGRYFLQAEKELGQSWQLMKMITGGQKWHEYVSEKYSQNTKIGFDPTLITAKIGQERIKYFAQKNIQFVPLDENIADKVWEGRPATEHPNIFLHEQWAGRSIEEKVGWVRQKIKEKKGQAAIFNDLSQIAWILNIRSSQIPHNPFFKSILVITLEGGRLYLPQGHPSLRQHILLDHLSKTNITLEPYPPRFQQNSLITKDSINYFIYSKIKDLNPIQWEGISLYRAIRTDKQMRGFRSCHVVDGVAMAQFWSWRSQLQTVTEYDAAKKIDYLRTLQPFNKGTSFDTISAGGPNGAIIHYKPQPQGSLTITKDMIHLVDSGGQYLNGTTDVTRAFHFGNPSQEEKQAFTRVLLGNLDIQRLRWPEGTLTGADIDVLARRYLWLRGWDYLHGTGHGVGYFAGVHESPVGIHRFNKTKFKAGMVVTNEPGYYCEGKFGIRIENMLLVGQKEGFNYFQNMTLCPYDRNLIDYSLLDSETMNYINQYHKRVYDTLAPFLKEDSKTQQWLRQATKPL